VIDTPTPAGGRTTFGTVLPVMALAVCAGVLAALVTVSVLVTTRVALGDEATVITSGSMAPRVNTGDLLLYTPRSYGPGDVPPVGALLVFHRPGSEELVSHRAVAIENGEIRTRGDANPTMDSAPVPVSSVVGQVEMVVPYAGLASLHPLGGVAVGLAAAASLGGAWISLLLLRERRAA